ncbi:hypothetical protein C8Q74DRAFT_1219554 [Fomes fomentarius]|nr:hypothetical protein C8Q74DRAFT_1219554 [Fomes fomentarius]
MAFGRPTLAGTSAWTSLRAGLRKYSCLRGLLSNGPTHSLASGGEDEIWGFHRPKDRDRDLEHALTSQAGEGEVRAKGAVYDVDAVMMKGSQGQLAVGSSSASRDPKPSRPPNPRVLCRHPLTWPPPLPPRWRCNDEGVTTPTATVTATTGMLASAVVLHDVLKPRHLSLVCTLFLLFEFSPTPNASGSGYPRFSIHTIRSRVPEPPHARDVRRILAGCFDCCIWTTAGVLDDACSVHASSCVTAREGQNLRPEWAFAEDRHPEGGTLTAD